MGQRRPRYGALHVVIIGLCRRTQTPATKQLFSYSDIHGDPTESEHAALTPYLFDAGTVVNVHLVVDEISQPLCNVPKLIIGSKPIDEGNYIFDADERLEFLKVDPYAKDFMRPFVGTDEFLYNLDRWILALDGVSPADIRSMPAVKNLSPPLGSFG